MLPVYRQQATYVDADAELAYRAENRCPTQIRVKRRPTAASGRINWGSQSRRVGSIQRRRQHPSFDGEYLGPVSRQQSCQGKG